MSFHISLWGMSGGQRDTGTLGQGASLREGRLTHCQSATLPLAARTYHDASWGWPGLATEQQQQQPHLYCASCSRYGGTLTSKQYRIFDTSNNMKPPWLEEMACVGLKHRFFRCASCAIERTGRRRDGPGLHSGAVVVMIHARPAMLISGTPYHQREQALELPSTTSSTTTRR